MLRIDPFCSGTPGASTKRSGKRHKATEMADNDNNDRPNNDLGNFKVPPRLRSLSNPNELARTLTISATNKRRRKSVRGMEKFKTEQTGDRSQVPTKNKFQRRNLLTTL